MVLYMQLSTGICTVRILCNARSSGSKSTEDPAFPDGGLSPGPSTMESQGTVLGGQRPSISRGELR